MIERERAALWLRVSSGGQDEANQEPDVTEHAAARAYQVVKSFRLHDRSAFHGEQQAALDEVIADIRAGLYTVLVIWHSDRLERREGKALLDILAEIRDAGGRVESVKEPMLGQLDFGGQVTTFIAGLVNHEKSRHLAEQVRIAYDAIDAAGAWRGKPPWGLVPVGGKRDKHLEPTTVAREYIPEVFARVIAGQSLADVCRWLNEQQVAPSGIASERNPRGKSGLWWPRSLGALIRNPAYMGRAVTDVRTQQVHLCEALVDARTWTLAGQSLDSRPKRGPVLKSNRCALSGASRCLRCGGPLYRIASGTGSSRRYYLRCSGTGPDRKSCGAPMIDLTVAEALADQVIGGLQQHVYELAIVAGNEAEIDARLAALDYERRQVALRGLSWADEDAERARIRAEYDIVQAAERIPDQRRVIDTGVSYGERWRKLDADGRATWLRRGEFTAYFTKGSDDRADAELGGYSMVLYWHPADED